MPGPTIKGQPLKDKTQLEYKCNGFNLFVVLIASLFAADHFGVLKLTTFAENVWPLLGLANAIAFAMATWLYVSGKSKPMDKNLVHAWTNRVVADWVMGTELNPTFLRLDLKMFWLRPSMMGWIVFNLSVAALQFERHGAVSDAMLLYQLFSGLYVLDYFWFEELMTSTWDIIAEKCPTLPPPHPAASA